MSQAYTDYFLLLLLLSRASFLGAQMRAEQGANWHHRRRRRRKSITPLSLSLNHFREGYEQGACAA